MKDFTLHFDMAEQCESLDRAWFGEMWFPVEKYTYQVQSSFTQDSILDPADLDLDERYSEPELCFSKSQARDPAYALLDSGAKHVLLPGHMLPRGAQSFEVTVNLAVGKEKAKCWRNEVYAEDRAHPLLPLGRLANLLDTKFAWENGEAVLQCRDKGKWHQKPNERHRCTLCAGHHAPFLCSKAQINGGEGKPNWYKLEYKRAKQDGREPDYRWGEMAAHVQADPPTLDYQCPGDDPQPQCAAAAMMHGPSRGASSSWEGGCPPIAEHQEWYPPVPQQHVIFPNPGYKIEANIWHLDVQASARRPGPLASFLRHCNTMDSPHIPSYASGGPRVQPADDIVYLNRNASVENLRELQKYSEKLQFEATCVRLWANGIQDQIMDEQEKVQTWIAGMTDDLNRLRRTQPAWIQQLQSQGGQSPQMSTASPSIQQQQTASSSAASTAPVKPAPAPRKKSMASAPKNAPFPSAKGADPWTEAWQKRQHQ